MKIPFSKINIKEYPFKLNLENMIFEGNLVKINPKLVKINAIMQGFIYRPCDSCGTELELEIKENLELFASDGIFKDEANKLSNTIEFFDEHIDLIEVAISELEAYLSDYFYCINCNN
ncbi:hypothetical protein ACMXEJ_001525 [Campylobacter jejuni]|uniref:hypothetical protein n=1 Tax=Campylobacter jejuni TaxID=197 RepID=UPI000F81558F|nr:hypothetical protein [Campylobacter jejuni]RTK01739.1 hypothetical protein C3H41_04960 [Campylobacter jejuni]HEF7702156.1 hypothetical protein [Campylobacter jejuni]HEF7707300.1 hypothetical protein [Campylobacter jejuni]HEF8756425.1 hypothetical protein [Campylobacter jejuni]